MKTSIEYIVKHCRWMEEGHGADGWPAIRMETVTALCDEVEELQAQRDAMLIVLEELECSAYWSEYDVTVGIRGRIKAAIAKARG